MVGQGSVARDSCAAGGLASSLGVVEVVPLTCRTNRALVSESNTRTFAGLRFRLVPWLRRHPYQGHFFFHPLFTAFLGCNGWLTHCDVSPDAAARRDGGISRFGVQASRTAAPRWPLGNRPFGCLPGTTSLPPLSSKVHRGHLYSVLVRSCGYELIVADKIGHLSKTRHCKG